MFYLIQQLAKKAPPPVLSDDECKRLLKFKDALEHDMKDMPLLQKQLAPHFKSMTKAYKASCGKKK
eukprot:JP440025.1.p1 GENE.JP440025.1~~JP440025.1.p1  ORF type:complete len:66 (-),score=25.96 JP440025.1:99-296(-)